MPVFKMLCFDLFIDKATFFIYHIDVLILVHIKIVCIFNKEYTILYVNKRNNFASLKNKSFIFGSPSYVCLWYGIIPIDCSVRIKLWLSFIIMWDLSIHDLIVIVDVSKHLYYKLFINTSGHHCITQTSTFCNF